jgi:hypothetical protein
MSGDPVPVGLLDELIGHSITYRIAIGPRTGAWVRASRRSPRASRQSATTPQLTGAPAPQRVHSHPSGGTDPSSSRTLDRSFLQKGPSAKDRESLASGLYGMGELTGGPASQMVNEYSVSVRNACRAVRLARSCYYAPAPQRDVGEVITLIEGLSERTRDTGSTRCTQRCVQRATARVGYSGSIGS